LNTVSRFSGEKYRTSGVLKSKGFYKDFIEAASTNIDAMDEVNSISKLTVLQAMRDGDFSPENLENSVLNRNITYITYGFHIF
jgi:hypothetical protein